MPILTTMDIVGTLLAGLLTLAIYSFLYKDNPIYKFAEHIFVGVTAGFGVCIAFRQVILPNLYDPLISSIQYYAYVLLGNLFPSLNLSPVKAASLSNFWVLVPAFLGILMFTRFIPKISWVSRISIAFIIAVTAGISVPNSMQATIIKHTSATIAPIWPIWGEAGYQASHVNNLIVVIGVVTVLIYFFFSIEPGRGLRASSKTGIIFIMIFFGAQFGYTVMGRISLVIDRVWFMLKDWIPTIQGLFRG